MDLTENQNERIAHLSQRQALCVHVVLRPRWFLHPVPVLNSEGWTGCPNSLRCIPCVCQRVCVAASTLWGEEEAAC